MKSCPVKYIPSCETIGLLKGKDFYFILGSVGDSGYVGGACIPKFQHQSTCSSSLSVCSRTFCSEITATAAVSAVHQQTQQNAQQHSSLHLYSRLHITFMYTPQQRVT